uniref:Uncharacterized protein n=1 Tax=Cacopsylla melanoneura TaxID=428564 RepID=A0A8D8ZL76_9HEMI
MRITPPPLQHQFISSHPVIRIGQTHILMVMGSPHPNLHHEDHPQRRQRVSSRVHPKILSNRPVVPPVTAATAEHTITHITITVLTLIITISHLHHHLLDRSTITANRHGNTTLTIRRIDPIVRAIITVTLPISHLMMGRTPIIQTIPTTCPSPRQPNC